MTEKPLFVYANGRWASPMRLYLTSFLLFIFCTSALSQDIISVSGTVTDESGAPIPGVSVLVQNTTNGTSTDFDGNYVLEAASNATLEFRYLGFVTQTIAVNGRSTINVQLAEDTQQLSEVVVIGYGTQSKESVTGSVVSIKAEELNEVQSANFTQALVGRAAGVNISSTSTRPGAAPQIQIRGVRSLTASNDPLIVLNGIPFSGGLSDINQNDIESLDILKDASATAIYGSRGANGVILITTKSGKKGQKAQFSYNTYYGTKEVFAKLPVMNTAQLLELREIAAANGTGTPTGNDESVDNDTDWQDLLFGSSMQTSHDITVQGGTENGTYNVGLGYFKETSPVPGDSFQRYSLRFSLDQQVGKLFRYGVNSVMNYSVTKSIVGPAGVYTASPLLSPYDENGNFLESVRLTDGQDQVFIPTRNEINRIGKRRANEQLDFGTYNNVYAELKMPFIAEGLKYRLNVGLNLRSSRDGDFTGQGVFSFNPDQPNSASYGTSLTRDYVVENQLIFDRTFADKHKVNFVGLFSAQGNDFDSSFIRVQNIPDENDLWYNTDSALLEDVLDYDTSYTEWGLLSLMGRVLYEYDNRYLLTATIRSDGSSRLAPGNKWYTYPAVSVGWNIANEAFMDNVDAINQLKLRAGYGETSNQAIDPFSVQGRLNGGGTNPAYNFGDVFSNGYVVTQLPNSNLKWEFSKTYNYGIDFGLFNNRLSGTVEYYETETNNILLNLGLPSTSGVSNVTSNVGKTKSNGVEIALNATPIQTSDFTWDVGVNLYTNRTEIVELASGQQEDVGNLWFVGQPLSVIYDYERLGLWNADDEGAEFLEQFVPGGNLGMIRVRYTGEYNPDGSPVRQINAEDRVVIDPTPNFRGGFNTRFAYKNFDLSMVGAFQSGGILVSTLHNTNGNTMRLNGRGNNLNVDYWTPTNTDAKYPAPGGIGGDRPEYGSTLGYFDGSYLKVRAMTLGYRFDPDVIKAMGAKNLYIYGTVQNPFVLFSDFHDESGLDPEITNSGVDNNGVRQNADINTNGTVSGSIPTIGTNVPSTRNYLFGLNITF